MHSRVYNPQVAGGANHRMNIRLAALIPAALALASASPNHLLAAPPAPPAIKIATGSGLTTLPAPKRPFFDITAYGAAPNAPALKNQAAINTAIDAASAAGGGTVVIPAGAFKTYSVRLKSNVGLHLATKDSILRAAVPVSYTHLDVYKRQT